MSRTDRNKWNERYAEGAYAAREYPATCLRERIPRLPRGSALDIACGAGRNALFLAGHGYRVDAIDISGVGLERARERARELGLEVNWIEHDLDAGLPLSGPYDLVLQLRFVSEAVTRAVPALLAPGGVFLCEQHLRCEEVVAGPQSPAFRVGPGTLAELVPGLRVLEFSEGIREDPDGERVALAMLLAQREA